jgi:hypothetical protein
MAEMMEAAGTHHQQGAVREGQGQITGRQVKAQLRIHTVSRRGAATVPIFQFLEVEAQNAAGAHQGVVAFHGRGGHGASRIIGKFEAIPRVYQTLTRQ